MKNKLKSNKITKVKLQVPKDVIKFIGLDKLDYTMTLKEKLFCEAYLSFKGNGIDAVYEAGYEPKNVRVAGAMASQLLRKLNIIAYINAKLEEYGFNDSNVEKQHLFTLNQYADLNAKNRAIDMFYKRRGSYAPEKTDIRSVHVNIKVTEKVRKIIDEVERQLELDEQNNVEPEAKDI